jgi:hypothetical protein
MSIAFEVETRFCSCIQWERDCSTISKSDNGMLEGLLYACCRTTWKKQEQVLVAVVERPSHHHGASSLEQVQFADPDIDLNAYRASPDADGHNHHSGDGDEDAERNEARAEGDREGAAAAEEHAEDHQGDRQVGGRVGRNGERDPQGEAHLAGRGEGCVEEEPPGSEPQEVDGQARRGSPAQGRRREKARLENSGSRIQREVRLAVVIAFAVVMVPFVAAGFVLRQLARMFPC